MPGEENNRIDLELGGVSFSIISINEPFIKSLRNSFILPDHNHKPQISLEIGFLPAGPVKSAEILSDPEWQEIGYGDRGVRGYFRRGGTKIKVLFEEAANPLHPAYLLSLLISAFYILKKGQEDSVFLHAAGIIRDDKGYVFAGPSGSGKTTISRLSHPEGIAINDELVLISNINGEYWLKGTPVKGDFYASTDLTKKLRGIFILRKDNISYVQRIKGIDAGIKLFPLLFYPANFSDNRIEAISEVLRLVSGLVNKIPCYELHFTQDNSFWHLIESL